MRRVASLLLGLALIFLVVTVACAEESAGTAADQALWDGPSDWEYHADGLDIQIKRFSENDITYYVADIRCGEAGRLTSGVYRSDVGDGRIYGKTSVMAEATGAVLAINGDYYRAHKSGIVIRKGKKLRASYTSMHTLALYPDGRFEVCHALRSAATNEKLEEWLAAGVTDSWCFGPILVEDGQAASFDGFHMLSVSESQREPRTAIAQFDDPLHYLVIVVDGRKKGWSIGMTLPELQRLFLSYGVKTAFNLDGGGSTTLYFDGEVINVPSSKGEERVISDILLFK